jgi:hypothetical protein
MRHVRPNVNVKPDLLPIPAAECLDGPERRLRVLAWTPVLTAVHRAMRDSEAHVPLKQLVHAVRAVCAALHAVRLERAAGGVDHAAGRGLLRKIHLEHARKPIIICVCIESLCALRGAEEELFAPSAEDVDNVTDRFVVERIYRSKFTLEAKYASSPGLGEREEAGLVILRLVGYNLLEGCFVLRYLRAGRKGVPIIGRNCPCSSRLA